MNSIQLIGHRQPVLIESIMWLEGEANYTRIHYQNNKESVAAQSLYWFEQHLNFIRVDRSAIINPIYVQEFVQKRGRSGYIRLLDDTIIKVSRARLNQTAAQLRLLQMDRPFFNEIESSQPNFFAENFTSPPVKLI